MDQPGVLDTHHKALSINLEASCFGSFAEIGAGQEVARWFLQVGGASGTVAKTISAYDKEVSDEIYGSGSRYVSHERLRAMLDKEWSQLLEQLQASRGDRTRFFSFVDTVVARNYAGTNVPHGWMGIRFQADPGAPPNDVILHFNLLDPSNVLEQEAIGILGVNLLYAAFHERATASEFLTGLTHLVSPGRLQIDYIAARGPAFEGPSSSEWSPESLHGLMVAKRLTEAVVYIKDQGFLPFIEALHKKAIVLAPGIFDQVSGYHKDMMKAALEKLNQEQPPTEEEIGLFCLTVPPVLNSESSLALSHVLEKWHALVDLGYGVVMTHALEIYKVSGTLQHFTSLPIRFVVGISALLRVFEDDYRHLGGSTLKAISLLFSQNVRVYAYPMPTQAVTDWINKLNATGWEWHDSDGQVFADTLRPPGALRYLYQYLLENRFIIPVRRV